LVTDNVSYFKEKIQQKYLKGKCTFAMSLPSAKKLGVQYTEFADFRSEYIGEYEAIFETALTR
jgi:hypothetical protein